MDQINKLLTIWEVCEQYQISTHHLRSLIFKKQIPFIKLGRLIRFNRQQLDDWIKVNSRSAKGGFEND
jgi:excisionase family DNA binding protein